MTDAELCAAAGRLAGSPVLAFAPIGRGGNSRLARVTTAAGTYAFKRYPPPGDDPRDRLGHEFGGLRFLRDHGVTDVPEPLAADAARGEALYEWIDGGPPSVDADAIDALMAFVARLHALRAAPAARALPAAAEAVLTGADLREQIERRLRRLAPVAAAEPALAAFLADAFEPAWRARRLDDEPPAPAALTLSPSDAGTHNMLRRPDGRFAFVDFEYFGWDDPVKLVADVLWHPAMALSGELARKVRSHAADVYGDDPDFPSRLQRRFPLFGLRWALIVLNAFLPLRPESPGAGLDRTNVKAEQLAKARDLVCRVTSAEAVWTS